MPRHVAIVVVLSLLATAAWVLPQEPARARATPLHEALRPLAGQKVWFLNSQNGHYLFAWPKDPGRWSEAKLDMIGEDFVRLVREDKTFVYIPMTSVTSIQSAR